MKKIISSIIIVTLLVSVFSVVYASAETNSDASLAESHEANKILKGDYWYLPVSETTAGIVEYIGNEDKVIIPSEIDGYKIIGIGHGAFTCCGTIKEVVIPDGVTSIGEYAFRACNNLSVVHFPSTLISIGRAAFRSDSLTSITIPDSVDKIERGAFAGNKKLADVKIGAGIQTIGKSAFNQSDILTISGYVNTVAYDFAYSNGIKFKSLGNAPEPVTTEPTESSSETLPKPSDPVPTETEPNPTEPSETATELISVDPMPPFEAVGKVGEYIFGYYDAECYELNQTCEIGAYTFFVDGSFYQYCGITDGKKFTPLVIAYEKGLINDEQLDKTVELMNLRIKEKGYFNTAGWTVMPTEPVTTEPTEPSTDIPTEPATTNPTESSTDKTTEPVTTEPTETITDKPTEPATTEPVVINPQPTENKPSTPTVVKPTVKKKANPINVTVKTKTIKAKKLKKKTQEVKVITVKNNQGKVTYKLVKSGITKKIRKLVSINKKGAITIKKWKKAKVGTYKIKVRITAKGNSKYKPKTLIKTVKIKIK